MAHIVTGRPSDLPARLLDIALAATLLVATLPLMFLCAAAIRLFDGGPVLFRQQRFGRGGRRFRIHKFRTLSTPRGASVSPLDDSRTTALTRILRHSRLDELPQLFDVLRGRMALVGPRPEVPANLCAVDPDDLQRLLTVRPGMTGPTQLAFLAEDEVLAGLPDPVAAYREVLVPAKVAHDLCWLNGRGLGSDLGILIQTPWRLLFPGRARARSRQRIQELLAAARRRESTGAAGPAGDRGSQG